MCTKYPERIKYCDATVVIRFKLQDVPIWFNEYLGDLKFFQVPNKQMSQCLFAYYFFTSFACYIFLLYLCSCPENTDSCLKSTLSIFIVWCSLIELFQSRSQYCFHLFTLVWTL